MKITVGTRGSKLALAQTNWVINELKKVNPVDEFIIKVIETKGDRIQNVPLDQIGGTGVFVKEIEAALLRDEVDFAVHSLKDMPSKLAEGLVFAGNPVREDPRDVLITKLKVNAIMDLPLNARIGTGSKRRKYQLLQLSKDYEVLPIRGNIDTRIRKLDEDFDAAVLAMAGINRLKIYETDKYSLIPLSIDEMLPAPCQGILGLEVKVNRKDMLDLLNQIKDSNTTLSATVERNFQKAVGGSCHIPIGAYCQIEDGKICLTGFLGKEDGSILRKETIITEEREAADIGQILGEALYKEVGL